MLCSGYEGKYPITADGDVDGGEVSDDVDEGWRDADFFVNFTKGCGFEGGIGGLFFSAGQGYLAGVYVAPMGVVCSTFENDAVFTVDEYGDGGYFGMIGAVCDDLSTGRSHILMCPIAGKRLAQCMLELDNERGAGL